MFQKAKIESALTGIPRVSALYTGEVPKGLFLSARAVLYSSGSIFADDDIVQLESVSEHCPQMRVYEMRRDGKEGDGRWPIAHSLTELPQL
jgi:hypothetical protein